MKVLILHDELAPDAAPDDLDVMVQCEAVEAALVSAGHTVARASCTLDLAGLTGMLEDCAPDVVFNLVESLAGHGRLLHIVPAVLDAMGIPYTGASAEAMFSTSCKPLAKQLMRAAGLPTPGWYSAYGDSAGALPQRMIVKSIWEHASRGIDDSCIIAPESIADIEEAMDHLAPRMGGQSFAEAFIEGREFNISLIEGPRGPRLLPAAEILFLDFAPCKPKVVGYSAKWDEGSFECQSTPRSFDIAPGDERLVAEMGQMALSCWRMFNLRGYARVDFRVDADGNPWILEVNANPCLSPDAGFAAALERAGIAYADAIAGILNASAPRTPFVSP